jgi:hypothetical protein
MKKLFHLSLCLLGLAATTWGCRRELDPVSPESKLIYPIEEGKYRTYFVIDTTYASTTLIDAKRYYKRELTEGTETDLLGREVSKLWLHTSPDSLGFPVPNWNFSELWTQYLGEQYAERIEGNTRYLVLKWPPYEGSTWNGNLYNNGDVQTYEYVNLDTTVTVQGKTYEHCVYVLQVPFRMPVEKVPGQPNPPFFLIEHAYEIYAPNVGKIVRYFKYYEEQTVNGSTDIDENSRVYFEEIVDHN